MVTMGRRGFLGRVVALVSVAALAGTTKKAEADDVQPAAVVPEPVQAIEPSIPPGMLMYWNSPQPLPDGWERAYEFGTTVTVSSGNHSHSLPSHINTVAIQTGGGGTVAAYQANHTHAISNHSHSIMLPAVNLPVLIRYRGREQG